MTRITPFLWFNDNAEEAINFYVSLFPEGKIVSIERNGDTVFSITFELAGQQFYAINGGPTFTFNEAVSFFVSCEDQEEIDKYWNALTANGGAESQCGWLKDKYGLSWQIIPNTLWTMLHDSNKAKAGAAMQTMLKMKKLVIADLQAAYDGA